SDAHDATAPLNDEVVTGQVAVRPGLAVAGDRAVDQPGIQRLEVVVPEAELCQLADLELVDQYITDARQPPNDLLASGGLEIDREALLIAVGTEIIGTLPTNKRRSPGAGVIARARPFYLDHLSSEVAEEHGTERPGQDAGEIENAKTCERRRHSRSQWGGQCPPAFYRPDSITKQPLRPRWPRFSVRARERSSEGV